MAIASSSDTRTLRFDSIGLVEQVSQTACVAFDIEHDPKLQAHHPDFEIQTCAFAVENAVWILTDYDEIRTVFSELVKNPQTEFLGHNIKYDIKCLLGAAILESHEVPLNIRDTMIAANLLNDNLRPNQLGLKTLVKSIFKYEMLTFDEVRNLPVDDPKRIKYAGDDAVYTYKLWQYMKPKLIAENLWRVLTEVLAPVEIAFSEMELAGIFVDLPQCNKLLDGYSRRRDELEAELIEELGPLNLNSGDQLAKRLFEDLKYPCDDVPTTASGKRKAVDNAVMDKLATKYPICKKISQYRTADKMISTYVGPFIDKALADYEGRIHSNLWLVSATGRTRMSDPNLQNVPTLLPGFEKLKIRASFRARPGWKLVVSDLSQIELRMCGLISQEPVFLRAFRYWKCTACGNDGSHNVLLHLCPNCGYAENEKILKQAEEVGFWHGSDLHRETTDSIPALNGDRQAGKACNFALIYVASPKRMSFEYPHIPLRTWEVIHDQYFEKHKYLARWHDRCERSMQAGNPAIDLFGRRRRISKTDVAKNFKHSLNQYVNFLCQASAAELIFLAIANTRKRFVNSRQWMKDIFLVNFIHDEVVYEVREEIAEEVSKQICYDMEYSVDFGIPIRAVAHIVDSWVDAK